LGRSPRSRCDRDSSTMTTAEGRRAPRRPGPATGRCTQR
jgi:hypothetical protein